MCVNQCESWLKELVGDEYCNLSRGKRVWIGLEKLEYNKEDAHAICYVSLGC